MPAPDSIPMPDLSKVLWPLTTLQPRPAPGAPVTLAMGDEYDVKAALSYLLNLQHPVVISDPSVALLGNAPAQLVVGRANSVVRPLQRWGGQTAELHLAPGQEGIDVLALPQAADGAGQVDAVIDVEERRLEIGLDSVGGEQTLDRADQCVLTRRRVRVSRRTSRCLRRTVKTFSWKRRIPGGTPSSGSWPRRACVCRSAWA